MTYLEIARAVVYEMRETRKVGTDEGGEALLGDEKNEGNEERANRALLTPEEAERLKTQIVAAASVEPTEFDRAEYDRLWARWKAHEAASGAT